MPNLIATYQCHNQCAYCFVDSSEHGPNLTPSSLEKLMPFIRSIGREGLNIVGGEPTLNPDFIPILKILLDEGLEITVFTNGKLEDDLIRQLQNLNIGEFSFCVNRTDPELTPEIRRFYLKLGFRIQLSLTLYKTNQPIDHLLDEISQYKLNRYVRVGIALPAGSNKKNDYLRPEDYVITSNRLFDFIHRGVQRGIQISFDCGFPYCFFNEEQRSFLEKENIVFSSNCGPIPDIAPDFTVIPCFPLQEFKESITQNTGWEKMQRLFNRKLKPLQYQPIFTECRECSEIQAGNCSGGCLALKLQSIQKSSRL